MTLFFYYSLRKKRCNFLKLADFFNFDILSELVNYAPITQLVE